MERVTREIIAADEHLNYAVLFTGKDSPQSHDALSEIQKLQNLGRVLLYEPPRDKND